MRKLLIPFFFALFACTPKTDKNSSLADSLKEKENALLKRELAIKEQELALTKKDLYEVKKNKTPISELYKTVKSGVFMIYTIGDTTISQGTGFFLNGNGVAISNYHVLRNADAAIVVLDNGEKCLINKIIKFDEETDYAIFQVDNQSNSFQPLSITDSMPEIGATCFAIGNPEGLTQTLSIGNISGYRDENSLIQTTTEITHGSSGGPLFNSIGEVIGITSSGIGAANLNFAINISKIPYQDYTFSNLSFPKDLETIDIDLIKSTIDKYYLTLNNKNYIALATLYTPTLDRFYSDFDISAVKAIDNAKNYLKKVHAVSTKNIINWESFKVEKSANQTFFVTFNMDFNIYRTIEKNNQYFNINIIMTITKDMKIKSVYENILKTNRN